LIGKRLEKETL
jgi:serine/threonine protein kinase